MPPRRRSPSPVLAKPGWRTARSRKFWLGSLACRTTIRRCVLLLTGYANGIEKDWKEREADLGSLLGKRVFRTRSGYGVHGRKTPPPLPPSVLFLGSPMHRPTSPGKEPEKGREGIWRRWDVVMLDGDEGIFCAIIFYPVIFLSTDYLNSSSRSHLSTTDNVRLNNALFDNLVAGSSRTRIVQVIPTRRCHKMATAVVVATSIRPWTSLGAGRRRPHTAWNVQEVDTPQAGGVQHISWERSEFES